MLFEESDPVNVGWRLAGIAQVFNNNLHMLCYQHQPAFFARESTCVTRQKTARLELSLPRY